MYNILKVWSFLMPLLEVEAHHARYYNDNCTLFYYLVYLVIVSTRKEIMGLLAKMLLRLYMID